jgi:hypothetical protein
MPSQIPAKLWYRHPRSSRGPRIIIPSIWDSGADNSFIHSKLVKRLLRQKILSVKDIRGFEPPLIYKAAAHGIVKTGLLVEIHILSREGYEGVIPFCISDDTPKRTPFIGHHHMRQIGCPVEHIISSSQSTATGNHCFRVEAARSIAKSLGKTFQEPDAETCLVGKPMVNVPTQQYDEEDCHDIFNFPFETLQTISKVPEAPKPRAPSRVVIDRITRDDSTPTNMSFPMVNGQKRIMVHLPNVEAIETDPRYSQHIKQSANRDHYVQVKIEELVEKGQMMETEMNKITFLSDCVLVDKEPDKRIHPNMSQSEKRSKYRFTLNPVLINSSIPVQFPGSGDPVKSYFVKKQHVNQGTERAIVADTQYAASAFDTLRWLRVDLYKFFGKIDLKDCYQSILLPDRMRRFFGTSFKDHHTGKRRYFVSTTYPQGYMYSGLACSIALGFILEQVSARSEIEPLLSSHQIGFANLVDDFIVVGNSAKSVKTGMNVLTAVLEEFGFTINHKKTIEPCKSINYCGYTICERGVCPSPTRKIVDKMFAKRAFEALDNCKKNKDLIKWSRSVCGQLCYFLPIFHGDAHAKLRKFYALTSRIEKDSGISKLSQEERDELLVDLEALTAYVTSGSLFLTVGHVPPECAASIILCDANIGSWSAILIRIISLDAAPSSADLRYLPDLQPLLEKVKVVNPSFEHLYTLPEHYSVVISGITGGVWTHNLDKAQSSTGRERTAQCYAVDKFKPFLSGHVFMVCDNKNSTYSLSDPESLFGGRVLPLWLQQQREIHSEIWLSRSGLPTIPDLIARIFEDEQITDGSMCHVGQYEAIPFQDDVAEDDGQFAALNALYEDVNEPDIVRNYAIEDFRHLVNEELIQGYLNDATSTYRNVLIRDIYVFLLHRETSDTRISKAAKWFALGTDKSLLLQSVACHPKLVIPDCTSSVILPNKTVKIRNALLFQTHDRNAPHYGINTMCQLLEGTWWPSMKTDIATYTTSCRTCAEAKLTLKHTVGTLSSIALESPGMFKLWVVDAAGPFEVLDHSTNSWVKRSVILLIDVSSRWLEARIVVNTDADTYLSIIDTVIVRHYGLPDRIHSDGGGTFNNSRIQGYAHQNQITLTVSPPQHPRSQGIVERVVRELKKAFKVQTIAQDYDACSSYDRFVLCVDLMISHHNERRHSRTGVSPYEYTRGIAKANPVQRLAAPDSAPKTAEDYRLQHDTMFREYIEEEIAKYASRAKPSRPLAVGQNAFLVTKAEGGKFNVDFVTIIAAAGSNTWKVRRSNNREKLASEIQLHPFDALAGAHLREGTFEDVPRRQLH